MTPQLSTITLAHHRIALGTASLGVLWSRCAPLLGLPNATATGLAFLALALCAIFIVALASDSISHRAKLTSAWASPTMVPAFAILPISAVLAFRTIAPVAPLAGWFGCAVFIPIETFLGISSVLRLWGGKVPRDDRHSGWLVPSAAGGMMCAESAVRIGWPAEVAWVCFAVAVAGWLTLLPDTFRRFRNVAKTSPQMKPVLWIEWVPPPLTAVAWMSLRESGADVVVWSMFAVLVPIAIAQLYAMREYLATPFNVAFWAFTFPSCIVAGFFVRFVNLTEAPGARVITAALLTVVTVAVGAIAVRSIAAWMKAADTVAHA